MKGKLKKFLVLSMVFILTFSSFGMMGTTQFVEAETNTSTEESEIPENTLRIHYQNSSGDYSNLGVWTWDDVESPTDNWPTGGIPFTDEQVTDYGAYVDVPLESGARNVGFLILDIVTGGKDDAGHNGGDKRLELFSPNINEVWISEGSDEISFIEPIDLPEDTVRVHYKKADGDYENWSLWYWGDVVNPSETQGSFPSAATGFSEEQIGKYGAYIDIPLNEGAEEIGMAVVNKETSEQEADRLFTQLDQFNQIFIVEGVGAVYSNPYGAIATELLSAEQLSDEKIALYFSRTDELTEEALLEQVGIRDIEERTVDVNEVEIKPDNRTVEVKGDFNLDHSPYTVSLGDVSVPAKIGWRLIDEMYAYDGELGAQLHQDGTATIKLWSPKADHVQVILYDKDNPDDIVTELEMTLGDRGVWQVQLNKENTGLDSHRGYYYHYEIDHDGDKKIALDPYAKSLSAWNSDEQGPYAKAAIVDPSSIGPELEFAHIEGFDNKEDTIIYEVHVRDFTSDPNIADELTAQFGTFASFVDKLDYIEDLGVTHIQLLPVMSYFFANEFKNNERMLDFSSTNTNYNWGYDPQSYFALTGMYSEDPTDPELRIEEFKKLIDEIHSRGMGVVLDVVYNHTARVGIFEDLVPNYYHFMDADGTPRTSFGGGRLGTTHETSRRILVDSITYWVEEFKIDGFRFDMMGDHDAESIQIAYDKAKEINPNIVMIGEGWITYAGDEDDPNVQAADQHWMQHTESVGVFSDEFRNELKSGFGHEGEPRFLTGGARNIDLIFDNIKAQPHNFVADQPGDVVPYIEAHDNLTLHDVIAMAIQKDPDDHQEEIHQRIRLGNLMTLTSQGIAFLHAGQEYGRTKQFRAETSEPPYKSTYMTDENGEPFRYPYFIHDSYDSTDIINRFDWERATNAEAYPIQNLTREYTTGLIELRRSSDAFRLGKKDRVDELVTQLNIPEIEETDLVVAYRMEATTGEVFYVFVNADDKERTLTLEEDLTVGEFVVDGKTAGVTAIADPQGVELNAEQIKLEPLTAAIVQVGGIEAPEPTEPPVDPKEPEEPEEEPTEPVDPPKEEVKPETPETDDQNGEAPKGDEEKKDEQKGDNLPNTATSNYQFIALGIALVLMATAIYWWRKRQVA